MEEDFTGMVCVCSVGRVGIVTGQKELFGKTMWVGMGIDGNGLWASEVPIVLTRTLSEYVDRLQSRPSSYAHKWPLDYAK